MMFTTEVQRAMYEDAARLRGQSLVAWVREACRLKLLRENAERVEELRLREQANKNTISRASKGRLAPNVSTVPLKEE